MRFLSYLFITPTTGWPRSRRSRSHLSRDTWPRFNYKHAKSRHFSRILNIPVFPSQISQLSIVYLHQSNHFCLIIILIIVIVFFLDVIKENDKKQYKSGKTKSEMKNTERFVYVFENGKKYIDC